MHRSGLPQSAKSTNWRRGLLRLWWLMSVAWIMSWALYLLITDLQDGFRRGSALEIPVVLCGPPCALLIVGVIAKWAVKGFAAS
jgi:hypothetical protein